MIAAGTTIINIQEGRYWISYGRTELDNFGVGGGNGLLVVAPGVIDVLPGTFWGPLRLTFETHDSLPPLVVDGWDEVVEVSAFASMGMAAIQELSGDTPDLPRFEAPPGTWFRARCHARGRDEAHALQDVDEVIEEHLLQLWPSPEADEVRHRVSDRFGAKMRHEPSTA